MNKNWLIAAVIVGSVLGIQNVAQAHGVGNGGSVVKLDGSYYLLDLLEAGIQSSVVIPSCQDGGDGTTEHFQQNASRTLDRLGIDQGTREVVIGALCSLVGTERTLILSVIPLYQWVWVELPLTEIQDIESPLDLSDLKVYQVASRLGSSIRINKALWKKLDSHNRAALIVHELIYALVKPRISTHGHLFQEGRLAREIVGDLFSEGMQSDLSTYTRSGQPGLTLFEDSDPSSPMKYDNFHALEHGGDRTMNMGKILGRAEVHIEYGPGLISVRKPNLALGDLSQVGFTDRSLFALSLWIDFPEFAKNFADNQCGLARTERTFVANFLSLAKLKLEDYSSEFGPTKYVSVDYSYSYNRASNGFPGIFAVNPGPNCPNDVLSSALSLTRQQYRFLDFGTKIPSKIRQYLNF